MRKGNAEDAFKSCDAVVSQRFFLPPSDHLAMEVRTARAEISSDGNVLIITSSHAPYCTSGFLMVCHALKTQHPMIPEENVMEEWLQSNICRCTSYQEIRKAVDLMYKLP